MSKSVIIPTLIEKQEPHESVMIFVDIVIDFPQKELNEIEMRWGVERKRLPDVIEHSGWKWDRKIGHKGYRLVAIMNGKECEGLLAAKKLLWPGIKDGLPRLYIAYIETAPWNNEKHPEGQTHRGVGTNLMIGAIQMSLQTEARGGICLHSLDQSRRIYRKWGMSSFGRDAKFEDMTYFEFSAEEAVEYLNGRTT